MLYGQKDQTRKNIFVFTMQADDMSDKDYQHENVYFCVCMVVYHVVKLNKQSPQLRTTGGRVKKQAETVADFYKCPKAYVLMSRHPFFNLFIDLLDQVLLIFKLRQLDHSKFKALQNAGSGPASIDLTFSFQANNDLLSSSETPDIIPEVVQFINILQDIKLDWIIKQNKQDPKVEIDFSPSHFEYRIPTSQHELVQTSSLFHCSLFFQMLADINSLIEVLACVLTDHSVIVVGPPGSPDMP